MNATNISESVKLAVKVGQSLAREYQNAYFTSAHLLKGLLHPDTGTSNFLKSVGKDVVYITEWADVRIEELDKQLPVSNEVPASSTINSIFEEADHIRIRLGLDLIIPVCVLAALCKPTIGFSPDQLKSFPLREKELLDLYIMDEEITMLVGPQNIDGIIAGSGHTRDLNGEAKSAIHKYCIDRVALGREGKIDPIVGRESEGRMLIEILCRRTKPNVMIIGDAGVGKTALVDGFALEVIKDSVPASLRDVRLLELNLGALIAGASYRGEIEDRLRNILKEIKESEKTVLFIDEIHTLLDHKGPIGSGVGNLLKPELARGELTVVGATTVEEYRKFIEPEQAFARRFEILQINEPDEITAVKMLETLQPLYEHHHGLHIDDNVLNECVRLAKRYMKDRRLPDSAIDLLDRTLSAIKMMNDTTESTLQQFAMAYQILKSTPGRKLLDDYSWLYTQMVNKLSPILISQLNERVETAVFETVEEYESRLMQTIDAIREFAVQKTSLVTADEVAAIVAFKTNIPLGRIKAQEKDKLLNMEAQLKRRVVGQDHALRVVADAILESRSGLKKKGQPIGSFFLAGPTGTGKTELAKSIAEFLFNDEEAMIRFDMSEFKEEHSAALLYGAPPGYVGYEEGGLLVNKIRQRPYTVLLFDEIEKAHPSVFDTFLQIMDEGHLHDRLGKEGDFSNSLILFTSNIGSEFIAAEVENGKLPSASRLTDIMSANFRPEFLGRLSEIVPFLPISGDNVINIFKIQLESLQQILKQQQIGLELSDEVISLLALSGYDPKYGARQLSAVIRNRLRKPISRMIISGDLAKGQTLSVSLAGTEPQWTVTKTNSYINL